MGEEPATTFTVTIPFGPLEITKLQNIVKNIQCKAQNKELIKYTADPELMTGEHNSESGTISYDRSSYAILLLNDLHTPITITLDPKKTLTIDNYFTILTTATSCVNWAVNPFLRLSVGLPQTHL